MNLIILTELLTSSPRFKPDYIFNENEVITNETVIFDYRVKGNKTASSNVRIEGAQTIDGRWCLNYSVWYGHGGFSSPTTKWDLLNNCYDFKTALEKACKFISSQVSRETFCRTDTPTTSKRIAADIMENLNNVLENPPTIL